MRLKKKDRKEGRKKSTYRYPELITQIFCPQRYKVRKLHEEDRPNMKLISLKFSQQPRKQCAINVILTTYKPLST
jgi:hypothetical protein